MSKYNKLWVYISEKKLDYLKLSFDDIDGIADVPIDHSFLTYKKELLSLGYKVGKISMKEKTAEFIKIIE